MVIPAADEMSNLPFVIGNTPVIRFDILPIAGTCLNLFQELATIYENSVPLPVTQPRRISPAMTSRISAMSSGSGTLVKVTLNFRCIVSSFSVSLVYCPFSRSVLLISGTRCSIAGHTTIVVKARSNSRLRF